MADKDDKKARSRHGDTARGPDAMFGIWAAWLDQMTGAAPAVARSGNPWAAAASPASGMAGAEVIEATLSKEPRLSPSERVLSSRRGLAARAGRCR
jgi:hypothetical protein